MKEPIRVKWLRAMYLANVLISGPIGLATMAAPAAMRALMGIPGGDPVHYGIAAGAIPLAFGIAGGIGLWFPFRMAPVLLIQVLYKSLFLVGLMLPLAVRGAVPSYSVPLTVVFVLFVVGDLVALPFPDLFSTSVET